MYNENVDSELRELTTDIQMASKTNNKSNNKKSEQSPQPAKRQPRKIEAKAPVEPSNREQSLTIVGIGASAGGLEALSAFFAALPADIGMAFVVVTHLHPERESHMAELLQKHTSMPTMQVRKKTEVAANHVYIIPPNRNILMTNTHLETRDFDEPHGQRTPIDHFFRSMAMSAHSEPVAIILSGSGTDGSVGIKDVKEVGGLVMVQEPAEAEYDGMPRGALDTGLVDVVLPVAQLAQKLAEFVQHRPKLPHDPGQLSEEEAETLQRILTQVHTRTGHDFNNYKRSTVLRRIERRMQLNRFQTLEAYLGFLRVNGNESHALFNDILIGVTNFFRDRESWEVLERKVIPDLFRQNADGESKGIRIWAIGCATGEEAYGLAMLLFEEADRQDFRPQIQIFASDLDEMSIVRARAGIYPAAIEADVSLERLDRFFLREGDYYRIKRELRDVVLFTNHNVLQDPPFARQDLITCRNLLIYLQRGVQDRVFEIFHYALKSRGYLFLGASESAEHLPDLFDIVDKKHRLYQARRYDGERRHIPALPLDQRRNLLPSEESPITRLQRSRLIDEPTALNVQHQKALEAYGPPSVVVNDRFVILHLSETVGRYLRLPKGPITGDLLALVLPELQIELRSALFHAFEKDRATVSRPVTVQFDGHKRRVVLAVRPRLDYPEQEPSTERQALVFFIEDETVDLEELPSQTSDPKSDNVREQLISQLQAEIHRLREQLQVTAEEYESSNEEMKAANEELQSINEEFRSATEELETSREELQSVNEELQTVNSEMHIRLEEISRTHKELENLMGVTEIATLFLDSEMRIQRFTAGVQELFSMLQIDRGRRISDLTNKLGYSTFVDDAEQSLRKLATVEREIKTPDGKWFLIRLRPYHTVDDRIEGVVVTFIDINQLKAAEQEIIEAKDLLEERVQERTRELDEANRKIRHVRDIFSALFNSNPVPTVLTRLEDDLLINVNAEFLNYFNLEHDKIIGQRLTHLGPVPGPGLGLELGAQERQDLIEQLRREGKGGSYETEIQHPSGEIRNILASSQYVNIEDTEALISTFIDITDRVRAEQQIRALASELTATEQAERHKLSQILHDDLQQRIFAVQMQLSFLQDAYEKNDLQAFAIDFPQVNEWLTEAIKVTRQLSVDLSPPILHGEGLVEAIIWLSAQMEEQYGLKVSIKSNGTPAQLEEKVRVLVFYALREILFNVVKHAGTSEAAIRFEHYDSHLLVIVRDQGVGFESNIVMSDPNIAHGLLIIRHRLNLLGCSMEVNSQPGKGTEVIIEVPYE